MAAPQPSGTQQETEQLSEAINNLPEDERKEVARAMDDAQGQRSFYMYALAITEQCWQKCGLGEEHGAPELADREQTCIKNCLDRFLDSNVLVAERSPSKLEQEWAAQAEQAGKQ